MLSWGNLALLVGLCFLACVGLRLLNLTGGLWPLLVCGVLGTLATRYFPVWSPDLLARRQVERGRRLALLRLLQTSERQGQHPTLFELEALSGIGEGTTQNVLVRMVSRQLVVASPHPVQRHKVTWRLTQKGRAVLDEAPADPSPA
ncbi:hypothetical protein [Deinococcus multiflagellatus]|uniref:HTH marR-type domain-containing protein n=1 Tax=Deinococcus multiflagellatus TaxID=1656887 RepID=A0ABW1ZPU8_9DEIO|nr:hypothetical protein [Deinococcus multiflagellatus]MBZ9715842.1 hypothetical protein [Deinococcus multiflagellatus]